MIIIKKRIAWNKGQKCPEETKQKISESQKGEKNWNWGKHLSEETKEKIRQKKLGNKNGMWKGGLNFCQNVHLWVVFRMGKAKNYICECCKTKQAFDWSNIDHKYKKDLKDYRALCKSCHRKWDYRNKHYKKLPTKSLLGK